MDKIQQELERAQDCLSKVSTRRQRLKQTIIKATAAEAALQKKEDELTDSSRLPSRRTTERQNELHKSCSVSTSSGRV